MAWYSNDEPGVGNRGYRWGIPNSVNQSLIMIHHEVHRPHRAVFSPQVAAPSPSSSKIRVEARRRRHCYQLRQAG